MLVIDCTIVKDNSVAVRVTVIALQCHDEVHKVITLVCITRQLLYIIGIVRVSAIVVTHFGNCVSSVNYGIGKSVICPLGNFRSQSCEPCACVIVKLGRICYIIITVFVDPDCTIGDRRVRVIGVGSLSVRNLIGLIFSVFISNDDMCLACCCGSHCPCHHRHLVSRVISLLLEVPVFTLYLVVERICFISEVMHVAFAPDGEGLYLCLGICIIQITDAGTCLNDIISTIRQYIITSCCTDNCLLVSFSACTMGNRHFLNSEAHDNIAHIVSNTVYIHRMDGSVDQVKCRTCQTGSTQAVVLLCFTVNLTKRYAAAHNRICAPSVHPVESVHSISICCLFIIMHLSVLTDRKCT